MFIIPSSFPVDESFCRFPWSCFFFSFFSVFGVLMAAAEPFLVIEFFYSWFPMFYCDTFPSDLCDAFYFAAFLGGFQGVVDGVHFGLGSWRQERCQGIRAWRGFWC